MINYWYNICVHTGTQLICLRSASAKHSYLPARLTYGISLMRRSHVAKTAACLLWFLHKGIVSQRESKREREPNCRVTCGSVNSAPFFLFPRLAEVGSRSGRAVRLQGGRAVGAAGRTLKKLLLCCRPFCTLCCALFVARPASALFVHRRGRGIDRFLAASVRLCILPRVRVATSEQERPAWEQRRKESVMSTWPSSRSKPSAMMVRFLGLVRAWVRVW